MNNKNDNRLTLSQLYSALVRLFNADPLYHIVEAHEVAQADENFRVALEQCADIWGAGVWDLLLSMRPPFEADISEYDVWQDQCIKVYFSNPIPKIDLPLDWTFDRDEANER